MRKAFFKYFISIFSITVVTILIQSFILVARYSASQTKWKTSVYNDFVNALKENLEDDGQLEDFGLGSLRVIMSSLNDNRVSGYVVRDVEGSTMFTFGKTGDGRILASLLPVNQDLSSSNVSDSFTVVSSNKKNSSRLNITSNFDSIEKETPYSKYNTLLVLPGAIKADDIAGSITIAFDGEDLFIIDLLTYSPRTYAYSKDVLNSCLEGMVVSVPICLVIALVAAWFISSRNIKFIDSVRNALNKLSHGESDVKIKKNRNSELNEISVAIEDLDKELQKNAISRRAWLNSISHDLNTPASAIKMIVDGMGDGVFPLDSTSVDELRKETNLLNNRIGKVIDFSSLQANSTPVIESVLVDSLEKSIVNGVQALESQMGESYSIESMGVVFESECEFIECDISLITKACLELLKNAFTYGSKNAPVILHIGKNTSGFSFIYVENDGVLPKEMEGESFLEPWIKGDWSRTSCTGSGLGLPIVCTIARLHNGTVSLENIAEGKVRATITLGSF